ENQHLVASFGDKGTAWEDFIAASRKLDGVYNGIIFKRHTKLDDRDFAPDDALFSAICEDLSHINSPYDFNAIPIHILGSIYERFLGKSSLPRPSARRWRKSPKCERRAASITRRNTSCATSSSRLWASSLRVKRPRRLPRCAL